MPDYDVTRIAGNIGAMNALNSLTNINKQLATYQSRLATGKRINTAADDPAGLTIATKMLARSEGLKVALNNIGDAKNLLAVAESGLGRINDILVQMRNKAEQGASDTMGSSERGALVEQMLAYGKQIDDIVSQTKWNDKQLINGDFGNVNHRSLTFQTGADKNDVTDLTGLDNMSASGATSLNLMSEEAVSAGITVIGTPSALMFTGTGAELGGAVNTNANALSSGAYTVKVTTGTAAAGGIDIELFKGNSTAPADAQLINSGTTGTAVDKKLTIDHATSIAGVNPNINLGNGIQLDLAQLVAGNQSQSFTLSFNFTAASTENKLHTSTLVDTSTGSTELNKDSTAAAFAQFMDDVQTKLDTVSTQLSKLGALTGRLTFKEDQVSAAQINVESAYNRIMNANMAEEQVNASKYSILQQTSTAMLAQANAAPQFLLSLFR